jgi:hypothetical protein
MTYLDGVPYSDEIKNLLSSVRYHSRMTQYGPQWVSSRNALMREARSLGAVITDIAFAARLSDSHTGRIVRK